MIPIDRTNYREVRDAIEKRGGRLIVRRNLVDRRRWSEKRNEPFAWVCVSLVSCSGLVGIFPAEIEEPATLGDITARLAKMLDGIEAFFEECNYERGAAAIISDEFLREIEANLAASLGVPSSLLNEPPNFFGLRMRIEPTLSVPRMLPFLGTDL